MRSWSKSHKIVNLTIVIDRCTRIDDHVFANGGVRLNHSPGKDDCSATDFRRMMDIRFGMDCRQPVNLQNFHQTLSNSPISDSDNSGKLAGRVSQFSDRTADSNAKDLRSPKLRIIVEDCVDDQARFL